MPTIADIQQRVHTYLPKFVRSYETTDNGVIAIREGSARVFISCLDWGDGNVLVDIRALVAIDVPPSPELFKWVAESSYNVGALNTVDNDKGLVDIFLSHKLLGDFMDPDEFEIAVVLVGRTANQIDDEIKATYGGSRFHEDGG